jgi:hypothetical protein
VASFVTEGFCVLPNLVDAGDLTQETVDEIFATSFAFDQKSQNVSFSNRAAQGATDRGCRGLT